MIGVGTITLQPPRLAARLDPQRESAGRGNNSPVAEAVSSTELTEEEQRIVAQLKARDREVRAHEQAHKAVGGRFAGAISYEFDEGPDGKQYAVAGEVPIDASPVRGDPKATIAKMEIVIAAALAPAEPSAQDRSVARQAQAAKMEALAEMRVERRRESEAPQSPRDAEEAPNIVDFPDEGDAAPGRSSDDLDIAAATYGYREMIAAFALGANRPGQSGFAQVA